MHTVLRSMATAGAAALFLVIAAAAIAAASDKELTERLVSGSPWVGAFGYGDSGPEAGSMTLSFNVADGRLMGEVTAFSGRGTVKPGPLDKVEVKEGQLSFVTPSNGVYQEMRFDDGKLKGKWFGRSSGWMTFSPSK